MALHSASIDPDDDPSGWPGDAKVRGRAEEVTDEDTLERFGAMPEASHLFRIEVEEVVTTRVGEPADHLIIEL